MNKSKTLVLLLTVIFCAVIQSCAANATTAPAIYADTLPAPQARPATAGANHMKHVETDASFPGGESNWRSFIEQRLNASVPATQGAPAGTYQVLMQFVVDGTGKVINITPMTNNGYGMEEEAARVLQMSIRWRPAVQDNIPVKAYRRQPITFTVVEKKKRRLF